MTKNLPLCLLLAGLTFSPVWANEPTDLSKEKPLHHSTHSPTKPLTAIAGDSIPVNFLLSARGYSRNGIGIEWDEELPGLGYSGGTYTLERAKASEGVYTQIASGVPNYLNVYADNGLEAGTRYSYRFTIHHEGNTYYQIVTATTEAEVSEPAAKVLSNQRYGGTGNDQLMSMIRTSDGGYLLAGNSNSASGGDKTEVSQGGVDFWIVKTNASGTKLWDKRYGGSGDDLLVDVIQTSDGGYILAGSSNSGIGGDKSEASRGGQDYWVVKISANGTKQWDKTFGGTAADFVGRQEFVGYYYPTTHSGASVIVQTADGGYLLGGSSESSSGADKSEPSRDEEFPAAPGDYWVVKMSASGVKQWDKTLGGQGLEEFASLLTTADGGYLLGGNSTSLASGEKSENSGGDVYTDYWLVKLGADGSLLWDKTLTNNWSLSLARMIPTTDGGYVLGGNTVGIRGTDICYEGLREEMSANYLMKINSAGVQEWSRKFHGNGRNSPGSHYNDILNSVIPTSDGGFLLAGTSSSTAGRNGIDDQGPTYIKSETTRGQVLADFFCDYADITYSSTQDYWIIKVDKDGNHLWNKDLGGFGADDLQAVLQNPDGSYLLAGSSNSGADGDKTQTSQGESDFWLVKLQGIPTTVPVATSKVRINCGGSDFKVANGLTFKADAYFSGLTKTSLTGGEIAGTVNDALYYTDRVADVDKGTFQYQIPVTNGKYQVNLFLAETYFTAPGKRVMSVKAEGNPILTNYDIFASQGKRTAKMLSYIVTVADGNVTLDFSASVNRPKINAIEIVPAPANAARQEGEAELELAAASLLQVAPNPFSENTTLRFQLEQTQAAILQLYDLQGHPLRTLFSGEVAAGVVQQVELESAGLPAGVYLVRLVTAHQVSHVKLSLQR